MEGISIVNDTAGDIYFIKELTGELKEYIIKELVSICHGTSNKNSKLSIYSLENTLKEFLARYPLQDEDKQKGFIGELLINIIIRYYYPQYEVFSPFFNKEQRDPFKKGFDIILFNSEEEKLWILESKSGTIGALSANDKIRERLYEARDDLKVRLIDKSSSIWLNAINDVKLTSKCDDEKNKVTMILDRNIGERHNHNVILAGILFHTVDDCFEISEIRKVNETLNKNDLFNEYSLIGIQKGTFIKIKNFIENWVNNEKTYA